MAECMPMTSFHDFHHNHRHASRFFNDMGIFPKHMSGEMSFNASLSLMPSEMSTEIGALRQIAYFIILTYFVFALIFGCVIVCKMTI
jgi:hypothetical protein